jgi:hypothetical protein
MVQILPADTRWEQYGAALTNGFEAYKQRSDEMAIQNAIRDLPENAKARDVLNAITGANTYSPEAKQNAFKNYLGAEQLAEHQREAKEAEDIARRKVTVEEAKLAKAKAKEAEDKAAAKETVQQLDLPEEQKKALEDIATLPMAQDLLKEQIKNKGKAAGVSAFDKKIQEKYAEEYVELPKELEKVKTNGEDIEHAKELSKQLGYIGSVKSAVGLSELGSEIDAVGFKLMQPMLKIFNPSGPVAEKKLKQLEAKYAIKSTDLPDVREGKLKALERFNKQAERRIEARMDLISKYNGLPPQATVNRFDKESETLGNAMLDYDLIGEEVKEEDIPPEYKDASKFKGDIITSPDGSTKYYSDGTRWLKK